MSTLQLNFFGDFQIRYDDAPLDGFDAPRLQSLLAYLLLHRDAPQSRKHLAFLLWQDSSEQQAHGNLRNLVHRLRHALPAAEQFLSADTQTLQWRADAPFTLDVAEFQNAAAQADSAPALETAANLYRGDLLPACYDEWILPERERLRETFVDVLAQLIVLSENGQDYQAAIDYTRRMLQADPLGEEAYRKLMQLYARVGDRANMVRVYQTCVAVMKREFDAEPSAATRELFERLRREEAPVVRPAAPRIQAKPNLPLPLTSFIGRTRELDEIRALLTQTRLVTLTGVGGGGKTRLAIQAAHAVAQEYADGAWFVDFAPLSDAADIPSTCAAVLGLYEHAGLSASELLADYCRDKELLLLLDNCEHLLAGCAALAQNILQGAPRVHILATSREPLNLPGEALSTVPPLSLPDPTTLSLEISTHSDAVQLFVARAAFSLPTFALHQGNLEAVVQICRRLDGIPLAIELAAARIRTLTPQQIATRLDDALAVLTRKKTGMPARHQTMRAVLDWSDALLLEDERVLFRRLAVFAGGFTLDAAEHVCGDGTETGDAVILDLLSNLIDKSLVTITESDNERRYRLLEPIREYARDKLASGANAGNESETIAARHLEYYTRLAKLAEPELTGQHQGQWLKRLEQDHDNLRAALNWRGEGQVYAELRLHMAGGLWRFWFARGNIVEGKKFLEGALQQADSAAPAARAKCYVGLGTMAWILSEYEQARHRHEQALALYREIGDAHGIAHALINIGGAYLYEAEYDQAIPYFQESLAWARQMEDGLLETEALTGLGELARYRGDYARARALNEESLAVASNIRHLQQIALSLNNLGLVATRQGDFARAVRLHHESLQVYRTGQEVRFIPECLEGLAAAQSALGQSIHAAILLGASDALRALIGVTVPPIDCSEYERLIAQVRDDLQDSFQTAWARGRAMSMEQAIDYALDEFK